MKFQKYYKSLISGLCFFVGISLILSTLYFQYIEKILITKSISLDESHKTTTPPTHLAISNTQTDVTLEPAQIDQGIWQVSDTKANYLLDSARPNENGNIIVYGHNTHAIFKTLNKVQKGDIVLLKDDIGNYFKYYVTTIVVVNPSEVDYILPTQEETLTLYTCSGWLDQDRLIVQAKPLLL